MDNEEQRADELTAEAEAAARGSDHARARNLHAEALAIRRGLNNAMDVRVANSLHGLATALTDLHDLDAAQVHHEEALAIRRFHFDPDSNEVALSLHELGRVALFAGDFPKAKSLCEHALVIRRAAHGEDHPDVATSLSLLGSVVYALNDPAAAKVNHTQALSIRRSVLPDNHPDLAVSLSNLSEVAKTLGDFASARDYHSQALVIRRTALGNTHPSVAISLNSLGAVAGMLGAFAESRHYLTQALAIRRAALGDDHLDVAASLNNLSNVAHALGDYAEAQDYDLRALAIRRAVLGDDHPLVAASLNNLGSVAGELGHFAAARDYFTQALAIRRAVLGEAHPDVATSLNCLGNVAHDLGDLAAAHNYHTQALAIRRASQPESHPDVAWNLDYLGTVVGELGDFAAAQNYQTQALRIRRAVLGERHPLVATSLNNLGNVTRNIGDLAWAHNYHTQALAIWRAALGDDHPNLRYSLTNLAGLYRARAAPAEAEAVAAEALRIALLTDNGIHLAACYQELLLIAEGHGSSNAAVYFGKEAVNALQRQRGRLVTLEPDLQRAFINIVQDVYHRLTGLLIDAGRLGEAQQVLAMLKEEEAFDFIRRDAGFDRRLTLASLIATEEAVRKDGAAIAREMVRLHAEQVALKAMDAREEAEETRLVQLDKARAEAALRHAAWVGEVRFRLAPDPELAAEVERISHELLDRQQDQLRALGSGAAMASYVLSETRLSIILTTLTLQTHVTVEIAAAAVNTLVHDFRLAIEGRTDDVMPIAQKLHDHLIGTLIDLLDEQFVTTLLIVPLGTLRYLPFAALHDGTHYLVERYRLSVLTLAAQSSFAAPPRADWRIAGLGVTQEIKKRRHEEKIDRYAPLPGVEKELTSIVKETKVGESDDATRSSKTGTGIYPGTIRLDEKFDEAALRDAFEGYSVVHVASHFKLDPARGLDSTLLLGDGTELPLERLFDASVHFHDVDLITLSACETGMGTGIENGREFEGFGALLQQRGAKAVLASLWPVADASTASLMTAFYREKRSGKSKAEALASAQIALINGSGEHAHPYHWAPFLLMGNAL